MGIDIYAEWRGQTEDEIHAQASADLSESAQAGYLRDARDHEPCAMEVLFAEVCNSADGTARISAAKLRQRLPVAFALKDIQERIAYGSTDAEVYAVKDRFRDFVALCEAKEWEMGHSVLIVASYY